MNYSKFIASNQRAESIVYKGVNDLFIPYAQMPPLIGDTSSGHKGLNFGLSLPSISKLCVCE